MHAMRLLALLAVARIPLAHALPARACYAGCRYAFCDRAAAFAPGGAGGALTGALCARPGAARLGAVGESGEALVQAASGLLAFRISKLGPPGLRQLCGPSAFKAVAVRNGTRSAVAHEVFQQGARKLIRGRCVVRPFRKLQIVGEDGNVVENRSSSGVFEDCVSFYVL